MAMQKITAKTEKKDAEGNSLGTVQGEIEYDFGDNLDDAVGKFGRDVVFGKFVAQSIIDCQAGMRRVLVAGGDLNGFAKTWKPGAVMPRVSVDPISAAKAKYATMSDDEKARFLEELRNMQ